MIDAVLQASKSDVRLAALLDEAREYAQIYLLVRQRQKGCEGMGELATLREEFHDTVEKLGRYCREKSYPCGIAPDDPDTAARELTK